MMQNNQVKIRQTEKSDLAFFYQFQLDKEANYLAAFTSKDPSIKSPIWKSIQNILMIRQ